MKIENLRELDAWICHHVFGRTDVCVSNDFIGGIEWDSNKPVPPNYSIDPAAAMQVLEKCATSNAIGVQGNVEIFQEPENGKWAVCFTAAYMKDCIEPVFAETLPLAIARFAKVLYEK